MNILIALTLMFYFLACSLRWGFTLGTKIEVRFIHAWYDMWIGVFWHKLSRRLYVFPLPCFGIRIQISGGSK